MSILNFHNVSIGAGSEVPVILPEGPGAGGGIQGAHCIDVQGRVIPRGVHFVPGPDTCVQCVCDIGGPQLCRAILCGQPPEKRNCKPTRVGTSCCEFQFVCPEDDWLTNGMPPSPVDMGVVVPKIIITAILSLLSISLLFFLVNRLRQRGRLNSLSEPRRPGRGIYDDCDDTRSLDYAIHDFGRTSGFGYPPQYAAWWRKAYYPTGEAPPPYEEAITSSSIPINPPAPPPLAEVQVQRATKPEQTSTTTECTASAPPDSGLPSTQSLEGISLVISAATNAPAVATDNGNIESSSSVLIPGPNDQPGEPEVRTKSESEVTRPPELPPYSELPPGTSARLNVFRRSLTLPRRANLNLIVNPRQDDTSSSSYQRHSLPLDIGWNSSSSSSPSPILERHDSSSPTSSSSSSN